MFTNFVYSIDVYFVSTFGIFQKSLLSEDHSALSAYIEEKLDIPAGTLYEGGAQRPNHEPSDFTPSQVLNKPTNGGTEDGKKSLRKKIIKTLKRIPDKISSFRSKD